MIQDLALERDDAGAPPPGPAFVVGQPLPDRDLQIAERCFREAARDYPGSGLVLFTQRDEMTGEEVFDVSPLAIGQGVGPQLGEAAKWRAVMTGWNRDPTVSEAMAWQANANARAAGKLWFSLQQAPPVA